MNMQIAENIALAALPRFGRDAAAIHRAGASRRGRHGSRGPSRDQGRLDIAAGQEPVGRQPAEGGARQMAAVGAGRLPDGRADARHRRGGKARDLFDHRPPRRRWRRRALHLLRDRGAARHVRPHPGDEPGRDRRRVRPRGVRQGADPARGVPRTRGRAHDRDVRARGWPISSCATRRRSSSSSSSSSSVCRAPISSAPRVSATSSSRRRSPA